MIDLLITSAVAVLTSLATKAAEKGAEEAGKSVIGVMVDKLKARLGKHAGSTVALVDLDKQPANADTQAALRYQLKADPSLGDFLQQWVSEGDAAVKALGLVQTANVTGDHNTTVQVSGGGSVHVTR